MTQKNKMNYAYSLEGNLLFIISCIEWISLIKYD
jgi:hypothetical protein